MLAVNEKGYLEWDMDCARAFGTDTESSEEMQSIIPGDCDWMFLEEIRHFLGCVQESGEPTGALENDIKTSYIVMAAGDSIRSAGEAEL